MMMRMWKMIICSMLIPYMFSFGVLYGESTNPCTNGSFEQLNENGFPLDWQAVGQTVEVSTDAHSGKYSLRMKRTAETKTSETGLNRDWRVDSGEQGAMLSQLKGGITFWYKAISAEGAQLNVYIIPMSARPIEDTGESRVIFTIPQNQIGDGQWHQGAIKYNFTKSPKVKYVHISPRIVGKAGEFLLDDVSYVEKVGVLLTVSDIALTERKGKEGKACEISATIKNAGDTAAQHVEVTIKVPDYLKVKGGEVTEFIDTIAPDQKVTLKWRVSGRRQKADSLLVNASCKTSKASGTLKIEPKMTLVHLQPERFIIAVGESTKLECLVSNDGHTILNDIFASLTLPENLQIVGGNSTRKLKHLKPGKKKSLKWTLKAVSECEKAVVSAEVNLGDRKISSAQASFVIGAWKSFAISSANKLSAGLEKEHAVLENRYVRMICPRNAPMDKRFISANRYHRFGYGIIELQAKHKGSWKTVAKLPYLSRIFWLDDNNKHHEEIVYSDSVTPTQNANKASLKFASKLKDPGGATWSLEFTFNLAEGEKVISAHYQIQCNKPRKLLCFEGPMLYIGEGSFGEKKNDAIFPGLEWLVDDEISSSSLDIAEDHPHRIRYVPHPNKITIPAMGINSGGITTGLLWNVHQKWDGENDRPSAVFASPNYFEGKNGHLIGLFIPSIPKWVEENNREATTPYQLTENKPLMINAKILLDSEAKDSLVVMDKWFDIYGVPDPMPIPRGSYEKEVEFSMKAYLESLWVADEEQWWTTKGAGALLSRKGRPATFCYDLLMGSLIIDNNELKKKCQERMERVLQLTKRRPIGDDMGFGAMGGRVEQRIIGMASRATSLITSMGKDGAWRFDADQKRVGVFKGKDYHELGKDNAAELGTCARNAYEILRYARMSGDWNAFKAAKKSLKFMKRFTVPRAAQVWEVPVHTPDILAASDAVDAYLEAYRFSGDKHYLEEAVRWARAGLPFLYVWNTPEFSFMRYASIPVFGASWFRGSWFGRAVQWNGLRFSYALLKLWDYDQSFPWNKVAEGIVRSAMYQQATEDKNIALWPDSISTIDAGKSGWIFSPQLILKVVYKLIGRDAEPQTVIVGREKKRLHINSGADISNASLTDGELRFDLTYPKGESGYTLITCVDRPAKVLLGDAELQENSNLEDSKSPAWRYDAGYAFLTIRVTADGKSSVVVEGARYRHVSTIPKPVKKINFNFDNHTEGWLAANAVEQLEVEKGILKGTATGGDPYMIRSSVKVNGNKCKRIVIRMKVTAGASGQFYWTTADSPAFAEDKVLNFSIISDGEFHEYNLDVGNDPMWSGKKITAIRIDPTNGAPGAKFEIDYVKGK